VLLFLDRGFKGEVFVRLTRPIPDEDPVAVAALAEEVIGIAVRWLSLLLRVVVGAVVYSSCIVVREESQGEMPSELALLAEPSSPFQPKLPPCRY
jgi:hypothetical protein